MAEPTLGVALIALNAAARLSDCLAALDFADEALLIDGGSTDATVEIARAHGARVVVECDWPGFGLQKNRAIAELSTDWILSLDTDEVVTYELAAAIRAAIRAPAADMYAINRLSSFCGSWIRHGGWYPDWIPRLFRRGTACFSDDLVHERLIHDGPAARLNGKLLHYCYEDFEAVLRKLDSYSSAGARQRHMAGQRGGFGKAVGRSAWAFVRAYFLRRGFLDGRAGFMVAVFNAETVYYRFLKLGAHAAGKARLAPDLTGTQWSGCNSNSDRMLTTRCSPRTTFVPEADRHVLHPHPDLEQSPVPAMRDREPAPPFRA